MTYMVEHLLTSQPLGFMKLRGINQSTTSRPRTIGFVNVNAATPRLLGANILCRGALYLVVVWRKIMQLSTVTLGELVTLLNIGLGYSCELDLVVKNRTKLNTTVMLGKKNDGTTLQSFTEIWAKNLAQNTSLIELTHSYLTAKKIVDGLLGTNKCTISVVNINNMSRHWW